METTLLTKENAHRVTMVRRVDAPESEPVAFLFRGKRHGYCSYSHLVGNPGKEEILAPADFKDWEVVEVAHPGYLEEYFKQACSSYNLTSFSPDERVSQTSPRTKRNCTRICSRCPSSSGNVTWKTTNAISLP